MIAWTSEPIQFVNTDPPATSIWISSQAAETMIGASSKAGRSETGGILIGRYGVEGWHADVVEATPKPPGSRAGWFWFQRAPNGLASLLKDRWQLGFHYLGEWHYHPGGAPTPSTPDVRAMQKIARDAAYHCPAPILLIVGGSAKTGWTLSATLFREGRSIPCHADESSAVRTIG